MLVTIDNLDSEHNTLFGRLDKRREQVLQFKEFIEKRRTG